MSSAVVVLALTSARGVEAQAVRYTVGPHGAYATIQGGIDACGPGTVCSVDVEAGTYLENIEISSSSATSITVLGGWDATFTARNPSDDLTIIDGGTLDRVITLRYPGQFSMSGFTITGGNAVGFGGGIWVVPTGASSASVTLSFLEIRGNQATSDVGGASGGGVHANLDGTEHLAIFRCQINQNTVIGLASGAAAGGGISISAAGSSSFEIEGSWIEENETTSDTAQKSGAGHLFSAIEESSGEMRGVNVTGNTATGTVADVIGSGGYIYTAGNAQMTAERCVWAINTDTTGDQSEQLRLSAFDSSTIHVSDSGVVLGDGHGLDASSVDTSMARLTNLTVADNAAYGMRVSSSGTATASLFNSIAFGNGTDTDLGPGVIESYNLVGVDPHFMAPGPPQYSYRLAPGSPGLDAGTNTPPGGLGTSDLDNRPRIENGTVDIGCYEGAGLLFLDGFEGGGTGEWSVVIP